LDDIDSNTKSFMKFICFREQTEDKQTNKQTKGLRMDTQK